MDQLTLKSLKFKAYHGFYEAERNRGNQFEVDVIISSDFSVSGKTDRLENTINYEQVCSMVETVMRGPSYKLIEALTQQIGKTIFDAYQQIEKLEIRLRKLSPPLDINCSYSEVARTWQR